MELYIYQREFDIIGVNNLRTLIIKSTYTTLAISLEPNIDLSTSLPLPSLPFCLLSSFILFHFKFLLLSRSIDGLVLKCIHYPAFHFAVESRIRCMKEGEVEPGLISHKMSHLSLVGTQGLQTTVVGLRQHHIV